MLPCAPAESMRALVARLSKYLGRKIGLTVMPRWAIKMLGLAVPILKEVDEMEYQWEEPFVVDDRRFRQRFGFLPVDLEKAAEETVVWAKAHYR